MNDRVCYSGEGGMKYWGVPVCNSIIETILNSDLYRWLSFCVCIVLLYIIDRNHERLISARVRQFILDKIEKVIFS